MSAQPQMRTGGCLCGAVRYQVRGPLRSVVMCHCSQCRRQTGHVMAATALDAISAPMETIAEVLGRALAAAREGIAPLLTTI